MSRTQLFHRLRRIARAAELSHQHQVPPAEVLGRVAEQASRGPSRRGFLTGAAAVTAAGLLPRWAGARPAGRAHVDIAIIGAGMAGLSCAWQLQGAGVNATIYEASNRTGGRVYSLGGEFPGAVNFPGQVVELGGELIDTTTPPSPSTSTPAGRAPCSRRPSTAPMWASMASKSMSRAA